LLIAGLTVFAFRSIAQETTFFSQSAKVMPPMEPEKRWGVRVDLNGNDSYSLLVIPGATYKFGKHQLYGGVMLNLFETRNIKTPFLGSNIMYQYYWSRRPRIFNAFAYFSNDIGKYSYDAKSGFFSLTDTTFYSGTSHNEHFVITNLAGIGCDMRFGRHFYGSLMAGAGMAYRRYQWNFTFSDPTNGPDPDPQNHTDYKFTGEVRLAAGYRF
jgi:hypothetical protein